jgi:hypothetical protein
MGSDEEVFSKGVMEQEENEEVAGDVGTSNNIGCAGAAVVANRMAIVDSSVVSTPQCGEVFVISLLIVFAYIDMFHLFYLQSAAGNVPALIIHVRSEHGKWSEEDTMHFFS